MATYALKPVLLPGMDTISLEIGATRPEKSGIQAINKGNFLYE